jgi:hypothetical protein
MASRSEPSPSAANRTPGIGTPLLYVALVAAVVLAVFLYDLRTSGIFACSSAAQEPGRYLAYCNSGVYNDYDHGAFWFGLEPEAGGAAQSADALFLGTSRMQFAFSSDATRNWFAARGARFYLLGFSYSENVSFTGPLLEKLAPRARVYVINTDRFFETDLTEPATDVIQRDAAESRYRRKRVWQTPHRLLCGTVAAICGDRVGFVRTIADGTWTLQGSDGLQPGRIAAAPPRNEKQVAQRVAAAEVFVKSLPVERDCVILTVAPSSATPWDEAAAVAEALGLSLVAPRIDDLRTFDDSHLDKPSAERWSAQFFAAADEQIGRCLARAPAARDDLRNSIPAPSGDRQ